MGHDDALEVGLEENGDRLRGPLTRGDERMCLLDDLLRGSPRGKDAPERAWDCRHRRSRGAELAADLDGVLAELDRERDGLDGLLREPARAVEIVFCHPFDPLGDLRVHPEGRW